MADRDDADEEADDSGRKRRGVEHLADVADGCGCAEVWEHISERRSDRE